MVLRDDRIGVRGGNDGLERVTATEWINGTLYQVVLEQDQLGTYREVLIERCRTQYKSGENAMFEIFYG